ncbi:unnamed protein product [Paramecium primaurelia]|uniref:Transmembrane protein n=1 Tax=Paramecium primaurelia TaxID=5886 RepID=A0A8S1Q4J8_PARPR|nr:unnamed protein product [Paramecium primaurelia]
MSRLQPLLITITIAFSQTIKLNNPIHVDYYKEKLNEIFLDHNNQLWFEFVKSIEILNPKTTICKTIPYQFDSINPISIPFDNITTSLFDNEQKTLFVLESQQLTVIQIIFTNFSLSTYHFRNGQANYISSIERSSYNITNGIALAQLEERFVFILNDQQKLILFDKISKSFEDILELQSQPIWITCANGFLFVGFEDKMIQYSFDLRKLIKINQIELILKESQILMIQQSSIYIQFPFYKVIKITFSQNVLQIEDYLSQNMEMKSLSISGQKISYLTNNYVFFSSGNKLFEEYDKLYQFNDLIILISYKGIHKVLCQFSDEISFPLYIRHQNVSYVHFMNSFGINYHLITRSKNLIQINEISIIESFIQCDDRIGDNQEAVSFIAFADGCNNRRTIAPATSCKFEGKLYFNTISTIYSKFSEIVYIMIMFLFIASVLILLAIFYSRKFQKKAEEYIKIKKDIHKLDQSKDQINQENEY